MIKFLECYPFKHIGLKIAEGFSAYDGNLGDMAGESHFGIDYVLKKNGEFISFEVYSMFEGALSFGVSASLGKFFTISRQIGDFRYDLIYAHLDHINEDLQKYELIRGEMDFIVPSRYFLGWSSATGLTHGIRQLHIELHGKNLVTGEKNKLDPYGVYDRLSSGKYRQPGQTLAGLNHLWISDEPEFA